MQLTNSSFLDSRLSFMQSASNRQEIVQRITSGSKIHATKDSGALSASLKLLSNKYQLSSKMSNVQNSVSYLQTQSSAINQAKSILSKMADLKIRFDDPTLNEKDRGNHNLEFSELSDQLEGLKRKTFNGISLFSGTGSGNGLYESNVLKLDTSTAPGQSSSITRHVLDHEDIRYLNEAGAAVKKGFGGLEVAYFPASASQKQMETITIGGNIAEGDEFFFNIKEQTALLQTESDSDFYLLADSDHENAPNPQELVRDQLYDQLINNPNIPNFLDVQKVGSNQITLTAKMSGDPYELYNTGSSETNGRIFKSNTTEPTVRNDTQQDRLTLTMPGIDISTGDSISLDLTAGGISRQVKFTNTGVPLIASGPTDDTAARMINGLAAKLNAETGIGAVAVSNNELYIYDTDRGTGFTASNLTLDLTSPDAGLATQSLSTTTPNNPGAGLFESTITIANDNTSPGGGQIPLGETYNVTLRESHPDETASYGLSRGFSFTASTSSTGTNQAEDIRDDLFDQLDAAKTIPGFQNNGSNVFDVQKIGTNQIKITGQNIGDTFNLGTWVDTDPDFLNDTQNVANISPFSIERSIEYLDSMLSLNAAEQSRLNHSHTRLQDEMVATESAQERLSSADYARESTQLARESISMQMASEVISKSMRLKDLLIPLTTSHHRGSVLNAGI